MQSKVMLSIVCVCVGGGAQNSISPRATKGLEPALHQSITGAVEDITLMRIQATTETGGAEQVWAYQDGYLQCKVEQPWQPGVKRLGCLCCVCLCVCVCVCVCVVLCCVVCVCAL